ncbi:hypothetical protein P7K49_022706 [Saguinus oedipus]|uniref:Uncharacterized protein n=1 Tax=Saguinus oedipus TaxID=9490 RepID=A0ABQ9UKE8_SAGOE|nr:hypothetical protein P7K49_022706 [Saguinus oedipus]
MLETPGRNSQGPSCILLFYRFTCQLESFPQSLAQAPSADPSTVVGTQNPRDHPNARGQRPSLTRHGGRIPLGLEATGLGQERVVHPTGGGEVSGEPAQAARRPQRTARQRGCSPERVGLLHHLHLRGTCWRGPYGERDSERGGRGAERARGLGMRAARPLTTRGKPEEQQEARQPRRHRALAAARSRGLAVT